MSKLLDETKRNPRGTTGGDAEQILGGLTCYSQSINGDPFPADHALLVTRTIKGGGVRRRVLFSLPSAQTAVARAESAGHAATITLVQLRPVGHVDLDGIGGDR